MSFPICPSMPDPIPMDVNSADEDGSSNDKQSGRKEKSRIPAKKRNHSVNSDATSSSVEDNEGVNEYADLSPDEKVGKGIDFKEAGNEKFKQGLNEEARERYTEGLKVIKDLTSDCANELKKSLNLNLSMTNIRLGEWFAAIQAATLALKSEPNNLKALYRRGYARNQFGLLDEAKSDLTELLRLDETNSEARRELVVVKQKLAANREQNKKAFGGLFNKTAGLYEDREKEAEERRKREEEERAKREEKWRSEMGEKKALGEEEVPFEKWEEEYKKKEQEAEEQRKSEEAARRDEQRQQSSTAKPKPQQSSDSVDDLDDDDKKAINEAKKMGYCYFRRELTEEEKRVNAQHRPQLLNTSSPNIDAAPQVTGSPNGNTADGAALSSWNRKGTTYEEKDMTNWAKGRFEELVKLAAASQNNDDLLGQPDKLLQLLKDVMPGGESSGSQGLDALSKIANKMVKGNLKVTKVKDLTGDAHVAVIRGTKRYLFEFHCTVIFEAVLDFSMPDMKLPIAPTVEDKESRIFKYKGELHLPEVSSAVAKGFEWLHDCRISFTTAVKAEHSDAMNGLLDKFKEDIVAKIQTFMDEYTASA